MRYSSRQNFFRNSQSTRIPCGSGLARECNLTFNIAVTDPPLSRASPLPQGSSLLLMLWQA
ncbi:hypothetical protein EI534_20790 [Pseudomonas frederiksbergensis]|nr:hypothetical protein [Pseudomonas frederiksbergensis]